MPSSQLKSIGAIVEGAPQLLGFFQNSCVDSLFVDAYQLAVLHEELAVGDGGLALSAGHAEEHVTVDVGVIEGGEGLVVHDDDISGGACFQDTQLGIKVLLADLGVVLEEHIGDLAPAYIGQAGVLTLCAESHLDGLQHVVGICVGTHAQENAGLVQGQDGTGAHRIAHVGLGVVDYHGVGGLDDVDLGGVHMDAVTQDGLGPQDAMVLETLYGTAAVVLQGVINIVHALGNMDVIAGSAVVGLYHTLKGLVGNGEESVTAEHSGKHGILLFCTVGDEVGIFLDALEALFLTVTVGDLIAQAGADAEFLGGLGNLEETAGDLAVGSVMVKDGGNTLLDGEVQSTCHGSR